MNEADKRLKQQLDSQAAQIAMMQRQLSSGPPQQEPPIQQQQAPQYQTVDQSQMVLNSIVNEAANRAAQTVQQNQQATDGAQVKIKTRMERLLKDYPALGDDDSGLVAKSREIYARIAGENPTLDEATRYELAVREAAAYVGARPVTAPAEDFGAQDWTMPTGRNPAVSNKATKSRLTPAIITNAKMMGINVDPNNAEGKKNLQELSEYSARFNADVNEDQYKYQ